VKALGRRLAPSASGEDGGCASTPPGLLFEIHPRALVGGIAVSAFERSEDPLEFHLDLIQAQGRQGGRHRRT
jgi:hypothetical protein